MFGLYHCQAHHVKVITEESNKGNSQAYSMLMDISRNGTPSTEGGYHHKKAGAYSKWAISQKMHNDRQRYGDPLPKYVPKSANSKRIRWTKPQLLAKINQQEAKILSLEAQLAETTDEMHKFANEVCITNVC